MDEDEIEAAEGKGDEGIHLLMKGLETALDSDDDVDESLVESILDACLRMTSSSPTTKSTLQTYLSSTLSKTLHKMMEEAVVIEVLFAIFAKIITSPESQNAFGTTEHGISDLLKAMDTHAEGEETLIEYACLVIEKLAEGNDKIGALLIEKGVAERLTAAETIITNVRNKKYVGQARSALKL